LRCRRIDGGRALLHAELDDQWALVVPEASTEDTAMQKAAGALAAATTVLIARAESEGTEELPTLMDRAFHALRG
jgi:hypothetical protein